MDLIRDLHWSLSTPPLPKPDDCYPDSDWFASLGSRFDRVLATTEDYAAVLSETVNARRLGIRFEQLFQVWLEKDSQYQLLAHNLPVRDHGRTLGEFDLLVSSDAGIEHWELACKFYLGTSHGTNELTNPTCWYGPNPDDSLFGKLQRIDTHQLQLSHQPAARQLLTEKGWQVNRKRAIVKGRLFHPLHRFQLQDWLMPDIANPGHEKGWWLPISEFSEASFPGHTFIALEKSQWLSPLLSVPSTLTAADVQALLEARHPSTLHLALISADGDEASRGFLVSDRWLANTNK